VFPLALRSSGAVQIRVTLKTGNPFITSILSISSVTRKWHFLNHASAGLSIFAAGVIVWAAVAAPQADLAFAVLCVIPSGIGVGPTLMGLGTSAFPASSFATGSGVINMIRQIGFAVGVAIFVAIVSSPAAAEPSLAAFRLAWWVMAGSTVLGLIPLVVMSLRRRTVTAAELRRSTLALVRSAVSESVCSELRQTRPRCSTTGYGLTGSSTTTGISRSVFF
jgi:hypothetical protein